ncbi:hypothetical protein [Methanocella sp. MCL-LM]|uniref:hypothetical protein n=1 Tax=Methanocella sp. MCL-LM TaxID=3412035 RepID=UPI003C79706D
MRLYSPLITGLLLVALAVVLAVPGHAAVDILTPVSEYQNASVFVNASGENLTKVGSFGNTSIYRSGGSNVLLTDRGVRLDLDSAPELGYRDVYLYIRLPVKEPFHNVTFDYDLSVGEKSNVLLIDFNNTSPKIGVSKGGVPDRAVLGLGTWSARYGEIGGLKDFPQGAHHVEILAAGSELVLRIDDKGVAVAPFKQQPYMIIHLMTGDGDSYLRGTISNLTYNGPPPGPLTVTPSPTPLPPFKLSATPNASAVTATPVKPIVLPGAEPGDVEKPGDPKSPLLSEVNFGFALAAAIGLFLGWAYVYLKYIRK